MENVFITGRGLITPLGNDIASNEAGLRSGKSGIVRIEEFIEHHLDSEVAGRPVEFPPSELIDRKKLRFCPPVGVMSVVAATTRASDVLPVPGGPNRMIEESRSASIMLPSLMTSTLSFWLPRGSIEVPVISATTPGRF